MKSTPSAPSRRRYAGPMMTVAVLAGFVCICLVAKWSPVQADVVAGKKNALAKLDLTKKAARQQARNQPRPSEKVQPIPGAGQKIDALALAKIIDQEVQRQLHVDGIESSPLAEDAEFLRRVYLDLVGVIPPPEKVTAFLADPNPNKRTLVIDELLNDPRFGKAVAEVWSGLMLPRESNNRQLDHAPLQKWLADGFNSGKPLNQLIKELLTASGTTDENGAATYFVGNPTVDKITDNVTRMFLGVQLQCAQCHDHPFTDWKQTEYWGVAAFFMKVRLTANPQQAAKKGTAPGIIEAKAFAKGGKKNALPESAKIVPAKFLQGEQPRLNATEPYRPVLASWIASPENPFFARAMVNRFWYQLFGRGIVNPVDDMHEDNPASHPALLTALTEQFKASGFDVKYLVRAICNSDTYQRSSKPQGNNAEDLILLSHRQVRMLSPEQLFDSLTQVQGTPILAKKQEAVNKAIAKKGNAAGPRQNFLTFFRIEEGSNPVEYQAGIPQALRLMNSPLMNNPAAALRAMKAGGTPAQIVERLYLEALSRPPSDEEVGRMTAYLREHGGTTPARAYADILWALINSSEFATNH